MLRASQRRYSDAALESWLAKVSKNWEPFFSKQELKEAQRFYREGHIKGLDLTQREATVHAEIAGEAMYAILDWNKTKPKIRFSKENPFLGRSIAAAGLYEVEELISDEINPLSPEAQASDVSGEHANPNNTPETDVPAATTNTATSTADAAHTSTTSEAGTDTEESAPEEHEKAPLVLDFAVRGRHLTFKVYWAEGVEGTSSKPGKRTLAWGAAAKKGIGGMQGRGALIRLSNFCRKTGFKPDHAASCYKLTDIDALPVFFTTYWPIAQERFEIDYDESVEHLLRGVQEVEATAHLDALNGEGGSEAAHLKWQFSLGEEALTATEAALLRRSGEGTTLLLKNRGLVRLSKRSLRAVKALEPILENKLSGTVPPYVVFSIMGSEAAEQLTLSKDIETFKKAFFGTPKKLKNLPDCLRDYQRHGVQWMHHILSHGAHALLADEMGLGKTLQVLSLLHAKAPGKKVAKKDKLPHLIVCPASVVGVWEGEIARFFPGTKVESLNKHNPFREDNAPDIWLASYTQLRRHKGLLPAYPFDMCVLDEAQSIKNAEAKATQACFAVQAKKRLALTGTPLENSAKDLWTQFRFLMPGLLGPRRSFENKLHIEGGAFATTVRKQLAPFVLRRKKADVLKDLPERVEMDLVCPLSDLQQSEYQRLVKNGIESLQSEQGGLNLGETVQNNRMGVLALLTRLRQVCCDPGLLPGSEATWDQSGKLAVLLNRLEELSSSGHKVVVFSQFVQFLERVEFAINERLPGLKMMTITGQTKNRQQVVDAFQAHEGPGVMLLSLRAAGVGLTLHSADYAFLLDPWWNPAVEDQAIGRIHRFGQTKKVFAYRMVTQGTLEDRIQALKRDKQDLFDALVEDLPSATSFERFYESLSDLIALKH